MAGRRSSWTRRGGLAACLAVAGLLLAPWMGASALAQEEPIKVGIMSGEDEEVWQAVVAEAAKKGLVVEPVVFSDYTQPNEALARGDIDANAFQHQPYLDAQIESQGYEITPVGFTAVWPMGLYSRKYASVAELPEGATIGVPNDPSNEGRALLVLQNEGLIKLDPEAGILATVTDIVENPKDLRINELDAGVVGRAIDDLDAAVVNTDWALKAGLDPDKERIAQEPIENNPYRNFIAVRTEDKDAPWVAPLVAAYQNETVRAVFDRVYRGTGTAAY
ncbi:MetQ/NlpA family ABC transporter substrate-binding protein [Geminicoccus flavidas]|uniref:MetQ/NlpA family ABC transporter substrate-binding protein n=1 Tax=Geminicoccus flavidas TaxID=2506407 RepID=UPI00135AE2BD|nr:MetQ/NlpA family ABC transporter substrate-binding protein [Geminicoccus flavidas]